MLQRNKTGFAKKYVFLVFMTLVVAALMSLVAMDVFHHGYFCDEEAYGPLPAEDVESYVDLADGGYSVTFTPARKHFRGFELAIADQPEDNNGALILTVTDEAGMVADVLTEDLSRIAENVWYKTYTNVDLKAGRTYTLTITAEQCRVFPKLQLVSAGHVASETSSGGLLLGYAYGQSTFTGAQKLCIIFLLLSMWSLTAGELLLPEQKRLFLRKVIGVLLLWFLLYSNYSLCYMDGPDAISVPSGNGSERLIVNSISNNACIDGYGLTRYIEGAYEPYLSQFGLQGHIFRILGQFLGFGSLQNLCAAAAATVMIGIVLLIRHKYDTLMAGCFFAAFWLSPWVINCAANIYWVEATWFVPMLVGLAFVCSLDNRTCRFLCYAGSFVSICIKCLCGYEFISTIMMGLISFPLAELVCALADKDKKRAKQLFISVFSLGICALAGFGAAILAHAQLRGEGDLLSGIRIIIERDVLRRTIGADLNQFDPVYWPSFNASIPETIGLYFNFKTQIITGLPGNLFPLLSLLPLMAFALDWHHGRLSVRTAALYVIFALASLSWFLLAKSHSYIHTHLNFVLWYFGFIQVCFYVLLDKLLSICRKERRL